MEADIHTMLLQHQQQALSHWREQEYANRSVAILDAPGLGKSRVACHRIAEDQPDDTRRTLIVVPASIRNQWQTLLQQFDIHVHTRVVSYTALTRSSDTANIRSVQWHRIILDEAHYLGTSRIHRRTGAVVGSQRAKACHAISARYRCAMTGTPCYSSPPSKSYAAIATFLGCTPRELRDTISIRRTLQDIPSVQSYFPNMKLVRHNICTRHSGATDMVRQYTDKHATFVESRVDSILGTKIVHQVRKGESIHRRISRERGSLSLRLLRNNSSRTTQKPTIADEPKLHVLIRLIRERPYESIIIFTQYRAEHAIIHQWCSNRCIRNRPIVSITGDTPFEQRDQIFKHVSRARHFQRGGTPTMYTFATAALGCHSRRRLPDGVFRHVCSFIRPVGTVAVVQINTCAVGLNLQCFQTAIFTRPNWNPQLDFQAMCRIRRLQLHGLRHNTIEAHVMALGNTIPTFIDQRILKAREEKENAADLCLGDDMSAWTSVNTVTWTMHRDVDNTCHLKRWPSY